MKVLIYTRPLDHGSSITPRHWQAALARKGLSQLRHELRVCHDQLTLQENLPGAEVIVSSRADLRTLLSPEHASLRIIFFAFAGVDHLAPFDWTPTGAYVVNNSGASADAIGEYTVTAMHLLANGFHRSRPTYPECTVSAHGFARLAGAEVTLIGAGGVGRGVAAKCKAFRMRVRGVRRTGAAEANFDIMYRPCDLLDAVDGSDFVVVACPVTPATRDLIDRSVIARMKPTSHLINVARGAIVDEEALCDAVAAGSIGGAVLDVVRAPSSDTAARVRNTPGILVTPHVSGDDPQSFIDRSLDVFIENLQQVIHGERPSNAIDFTLGY